MPYTEV